MRYMSKRPLTPREAEVAALIAKGYRDREIAELLGVNVRTIEAHALKSFIKAGVRNRRDLAAWWTEQAPEQEAVS